MNGERVKELEEKLRRIAFIRPGYGLPVITPDGVYGSETEKAVGMMQERAGLRKTGKTDRKTEEFIDAEYESACRDSAEGKPLYPFPYPRYLAKKNERSEFVHLLTAVLRSLAGRYESAGRVTCGDLYDDSVADAVREFQRINLLPETGETDKATWDRLADEFNGIYCNRCSDG